MTTADYVAIDRELASAMRRIQIARLKLAAADRKYQERLRGGPHDAR